MKSYLVHSVRKNFNTGVKKESLYVWDSHSFYQHLPSFCKGPEDKNFKRNLDRVNAFIESSMKYTLFEGGNGSLVYTIINNAKEANSLPTDTEAHIEVPVDAELNINDLYKELYTAGEARKRAVGWRA